MLAKVSTGTTVGLDGTLITVEVDIAERGFPTFTIVGLPGKEVNESKDRVRTALANAGFQMPDSRLTVNLAPADIPKVGSSFDLPIAVGILAAQHAIPKETLEDSFFIGELSLEGNVRPVSGVMPLALMAREKHKHIVFVPTMNADEAAYIDGITVYAVNHILDVVHHFQGSKLMAPHMHVISVTDYPAVKREPQSRGWFASDHQACHCARWDWGAYSMSPLPRHASWRLMRGSSPLAASIP
jgi:magnesium chelatase family protein